MSLKIAFIGAGSLTFTRKLLSDILAVPELAEAEIAFTDLNEVYLEKVRELCQRDIAENGLSIQIQTSLDRREAFRGANFVVNCVRVGGLEMFETDVEIPLKYGVDQCVGDTLCAGGIFYGQRGIAAMLAFCRDIREVAAADCLLLNYANPNAMVTWACNQYGGVKTIGLCHGVQAGAQLVARLFEIPYEELDYVCAGINHQTWYLELRHKGRDLRPGLLEALEADEFCAKNEKVRIDMLRHFGYFSTESNGHLSEYLPWYRKRPNGLAQWIGEGWIYGETGGYLRVTRETRDGFMTDYEQESKKTQKYGKRSVEHGSYIIESLVTGRMYRGHFNVVNQGCISNLPEDAIVEVPCYVDGNGIQVPRVGDLPLGPAAVCNASISVQRMSVEAAVHGDVALLKQAMLMDPLVGAVCTTQEVADMTEEMLVAGKAYLPQYAHFFEPSTPEKQSK